MPKNKHKKKVPKNKNMTLTLNKNDSDEELTGPPAMMAAFKKVFPGSQCIQVDSSRGAQHATVHLEPGQTREDVEKHLGRSLEDQGQIHMNMKRDMRQNMAKAGVILDPGPNGIYDAEDTGRFIKGSPGDKAGGGLAGTMAVMMKTMSMGYKSSDEDEEDYTEEATKHWPDWAKKTLEPRAERKKKQREAGKMLKEMTEKKEKKMDTSNDSKEKKMDTSNDSKEKKMDTSNDSKVKKQDPPKQLKKVLPAPLEFPHPIVKWAQRSNLVFLTVCIQDCKNPEIKVEENKLYFKGKTGLDEKVYEVEIKFFKEIDPENSKYAIRDRGIEFALEKKECTPYWSRLLKDTSKQHWLKIDFDKWLDESEGSSSDGYESSDYNGSSDEETWQPEDYVKSMSSLSDLGKNAEKSEEMSSGANEKWNPDSDSDNTHTESTDDDAIPDLE